MSVSRGVLSVTYLSAEGCRVAFRNEDSCLKHLSKQFRTGPANLLTLAKVTDGLLDLFHIQETQSRGLILTKLLSHGL